jgi:NAD(P)-dependent dehydrogenase (short-subunit alcohol dehydrogenase family)
VRLIHRHFWHRASIFQFQSYRRQEKGEEAIRQLKHPRAMFCKLDLCDMGSIEACADFIRERVGQLDILVNNAGIAYDNDSDAPFAEQVGNIAHGE